MENNKKSQLQIETNLCIPVADKMLPRLLSGGIGGIVGMTEK